MESQKWCFSCQIVCIVRGKNLAVHSTLGLNREVGSKQGGGGHPHVLTVLHRGKADTDILSICLN